ncbi:hypothetical protein F5148DRAFT_772027 [Russula earlei]|uniref:Uncharacterized protein n=1 Tax=Russula earlei TaxID=71964 RepID=A0ACC0UC54_9AGAM|nr:hypothetical protein F5148DRAFT_772027 [Russula earlei]
MEWKRQRNYETLVLTHVCQLHLAIVITITYHDTLIYTSHPLPPEGSGCTAARHIFTPLHNANLFRPVQRLMTRRRSPFSTKTKRSKSNPSNSGVRLITPLHPSTKATASRRCGYPVPPHRSLFSTLTGAWGIGHLIPGTDTRCRRVSERSDATARKQAYCRNDDTVTFEFSSRHPHRQLRTTWGPPSPPCDALGNARRVPLARRAIFSPQFSRPPPPPQSFKCLRR